MKKTKKKVRCIKAGSQWYKQGQVYNVYKYDDKEFVQGSDGFYDMLGKSVSKFEPYETK
jgi:hypothetical protein